MQKLQFICGLGAIVLMVKVFIQNKVESPDKNPIIEFLKFFIPFNAFKYILPYNSKTAKESGVFNKKTINTLLIIPYLIFIVFFTT